MPIYCRTLETPVGKMIAGVNDNGISLFEFEYRKLLPKIKERVVAAQKDELVTGHHPLHNVVEEQITAYFNGTRTVFDLPLVLSGSPFQVKVWKNLLDIPFGTTRTYMQQARQYGDIKAIRAVASANGANCLAIIVPCHRVIGSDGSLTGYAGGINNKKWLLQHEQIHSKINIQKTLF